MTAGTIASDRKRTLFTRMRRGIEWVLLLIGLAALDTYIWINASSSLYESYEDWAFDQDLRRLAPSPLRFAAEEFKLLLGHERVRTAGLQTSPTQANGALKSKTPEPMPLKLNKPAPSELIGRLQIPNLHLTAMVREGADSRTLRLAVGHIPGTPLPGARGNVGLAGHRDTFFRALRNIQIDDRIEFQTEDQLFSYQVRSTRIVGPRDVRVLASTSGDSLTLVTCYPFYYAGSAPKRFIVRAALVSRLPRGAVAASE